MGSGSFHQAEATYISGCWRLIGCLRVALTSHPQSNTAVTPNNARLSDLLKVYLVLTIKVGISGMTISEPWIRIKFNGQLQSLQYFQQRFRVKLLLMLENALKLNFLRPSFEPSPRANTYSDSIINKHTELVKKLCMGLSWHAGSSILQVKALYCTEKQGFGYLWLSKNSSHTHQNLPSFRKVSLPPEKLHMLFPTHLWVSEFWPQNLHVLPLTDPGLRPTVQTLASMKMGRTWNAKWSTF